MSISDASLSEDPPFLPAGILLPGFVLLPFVFFTWGEAVRTAGCSVLASLILSDLYIAGYAMPVTAGMTALAFASAGVALPIAGAGGSLWLTLAVYLIGSRANAFARHRSIRNIIALGIALAIAQCLHPLGGVIGALALPLLAVTAWPDDIRHRPGFAALLMFIPLVSALILAWLHGKGIMYWQPARGVSLDANLLPVLPALSAILAVLFAVPILWLSLAVRALRKRPVLILSGIGATIALAFMLSAWRGTHHDMASMLGVSMALSIALIASWPRPRRNGALALSALALTAVLSWLVPFVVAALEL